MSIQEQTPSLEIERKYLINLENGKRAFEAHLKYFCKQHNLNLKVYIISQCYLQATEGERRVRQRKSQKGIQFFYTEKFPKTEVTRIENEREISMREYVELLSEADPNLHTIEKARYVFDYEGLTLEIDIYGFSDTRAILEVELPSEDTEVKVPFLVEIIKEVTADKRYKNRSLAQSYSFAD